MDNSPLWLIIKDVVLFLVALYGAALSTFNWRQAVRKDRREITITATTAMPTYPNGELGSPFAKLEAINTGHRPVTVTTITFELPTGGRLFSMKTAGIPGLPNTPLPATLSDGQTAFLMIPYADIGAALLHNGKIGTIKLTPVCVDTANNVYRGEAWEVDPQEFLRMGQLAHSGDDPSPR
jgi:hypothetical protein